MTESNVRSLIDNLAEISHKLILSSKGFSNLDLENAIEASGIDVRYFVNKDYASFLKWDAQQECPIIAVNADQAPIRQRFSMAHELGHLIIDWNWIPYGDHNKSFNEDRVLNVTLYRGMNKSVEETNVNEFVVAFLMPDSLLKQLTDKIKEKEISYSGAIKELKNKTGVSGISTGFRLKNYCQNKGLNIVD